MDVQCFASSITIASCGVTNQSLFSHGTKASFCRFGMYSGSARRKWSLRKSTRASSSSVGETLVGTPQTAVAQPIKSQIGSPLLWVAVGVGLSVWFSVMVTKVKRYAINKAFKAVMGEAEAGGQFNALAFAEGLPFPSISTVAADVVAASRKKSSATSDIIPTSLL